MRGDEKKAAIAAYKERKVVGGVYRVRCLASGEVWVGQWPDLETIQNRIWFGLRLGTNPNRDLQRAWQQHGAEQFRFEILERLADEESPYIRDALLKKRAAHWRSELGAKRL